MKNIFLLIAVGLVYFISFSQSIAQGVGVGTNTPEAVLDVFSNDDGFLIPRVALTATNSASPLTSPTVSEMVYNTATAGTPPNNVTPGYYYWDGAAWKRFLDGGNSGNFIHNQNTTNQTADFRITGTGRANTSFQSPLYTRADAGTVAIRPNTNSTTAIQLQNAGGTNILNVDASNLRVGIGTSSPAHRLHVEGTVRADELVGPFDQSGSGYIRIGDMQIAWGTATINIGTWSYNSNGIYFQNTVTTINFPASFSAPPVLSITNRDSQPDTRACYVTNFNSNTSNFTVNWISAPNSNGINTTTSGFTIHWMAIGKWR